MLSLFENLWSSIIRLFHWALFVKKFYRPTRLYICIYIYIHIYIYVYIMFFFTWILLVSIYLVFHLLYQKTQNFSFSPGISWKAQKDQVNIIFPSTFWLKKRSSFPFPKIPKQKCFNNQYISSFHQRLGSKKDRISYIRRVQNKNFSVISKPGVPC